MLNKGMNDIASKKGKGITDLQFLGRHTINGTENIHLSFSMKKSSNVTVYLLFD